MTDPAEIQSFPSSVRQPSHLAPPFRSRQWNQNPGGLATPGLYVSMGPGVLRIVWGINWSNTFSTRNAVAAGGFQTGEPFPAGMRGVYAWQQVVASTTNPGVLGPGHCQWSIYKNGSPVPGWLNVNTGEEWTSPIATRYRTNRLEVNPILVPISLEEGDQIDVSLQNFGAGELAFWLVYWTAGGWIYPVTVEGDAGSIRGTLADPGIAQPLRDPFGRAQPPRRRR